MGAITSALNGGDNFVRYRTGGAHGFQVDLTLVEPSDLAGISIMIHELASGDPAKGYSGIDIYTSTGGAYKSVFKREAMFGSFERGATFTEPAQEYTNNQWTNHAFRATEVGVTNVRLVFGQADQSGDSWCASPTRSFLRVFARVDVPGTRTAVPAVQPVNVLYIYIYMRRYLRTLHASFLTAKFSLLPHTASASTASGSTPRARTTPVPPPAATSRASTTAPPRRTAARRP
jgi:hypothetical protein